MTEPKKPKQPYGPVQQMSESWRNFSLPYLRRDMMTEMPREVQPKSELDDPPKKKYHHCSRMRRLIEASKEERPRSSPAEHLLGKEGVDGSTPSLGSTVTDDIDEICPVCLKQSIMPFFDGVCSWCGLKCKSCGQSYACEHRNSWSGEYRENHVPSEEILEKARAARYKLMGLPASRFSVRELWHITSEPDVERVWILEALWDREKPKT